MLLTELHELLPSKLFSKKLGETISSLLTDAAGDELLIGDVKIVGHNPTVLHFEVLGGDAEGGASNKEVKAYIKKLTKMATKAFSDAKIQTPTVKVTAGTDMAGDVEIAVVCTWNWGQSPPTINPEALKAGIGDGFDVEVEL